MEIWQTERLTGNALTDAYLQGDPRIRDRFEFAPQQADAVKRRCHTIDHLFDHAHRKALVAALTDYAKEQNLLNEASQLLLDKLSDDRCMTVVTGQQAGLFSGPLYTVYKAVSAVALAKHYEEVMCRPVVPVFWIAAEDHDFDEVASAYYVDKDAKIARVRLHERPVGRVPIGLYAISDTELDKLLAQLAVELPEGMYKSQLLEDLDFSYRGATNMGDAFARLMARFLKDVPILFLNPIYPTFRRLVKDAFARVIKNPYGYMRAAQSGAEALTKRGFAPQVELHPDHSLLFIVDKGRRYALDVDRFQPDRFVLRDTEQYFTKEELLLRLQEQPSDFSSGVLYRPVVQDFLLPVLAYVGGPAEIAYHGMLKEVFAEAGRHLPILQLRMRVTALPTAVTRALEHLGVTLEDGLKRNLLKESLVRDLSPSLDTVMREMEQWMRKALLDREAYFLGIDVTLRASLERAKEMMTRSLRHLENRSLQALERKNKETAYLATVLSSWLRPALSEQERILSPLSLFSKYGISWITALLELEYSPLLMTYIRF
ncbi:bacillithiol biosynthesis cysteine-adding enzyme BshC [Sulfoacidibacillus thermotolerans]|uniref:Putative cysteine ligase BshC n=1 Tax=Sulfoacidibacillus thermotolerans TaxID=1765684 RepID=A0A2U3D8W5_SULT2|nr:bacillithiol biosynthesis cysteine-adding enzyme BshC [Sulfoacidibacillus thermotolerans]PWI57711.1 bacillithiol biosynthesis cysteine-adding enzyme BshC [Sulfoacidibacillus thermotolerans]